MKNILVMFMLLLSILYSDNNIIMLNGEQDSDVAEMLIRGNGEECKVSMDSTGTLVGTNCLQITNSKGIDILCTAKKKMCKTIAEVQNVVHPYLPPQIVKAETKIDKTISNGYNEISMMDCLAKDGIKGWDLKVDKPTCKKDGKVIAYIDSSSIKVAKKIVEEEAARKLLLKLDEVRNEGRVYAGIAMDVPLLSSGKKVTGTNGNGEKGCNIQFAGMTGTALEKDGLVYKISLESYNMPYEQLNKIITSMNNKYQLVDYTKDEKHKTVKEVQNGILGLYSTFGGSEADLYRALRNAKPSSTITETSTFTNRGDSITLKQVKTVNDKRTKYKLEVEYLSKRTVEEQEMKLRKKQEIESAKKSKEISEISGL